mgnify:CR=1 FL=1|tara:strand:- start:1319 stop:1582 length:264 start_codon:yes stop_codon:yes gene_type:complete
MSLTEFSSSDHYTHSQPPKKLRQGFTLRDAHWLVDGVYDEEVAEMRVAIANKRMCADEYYSANAHRALIDAHLEERQLDAEIAEYII